MKFSPGVIFSCAGFSTFTYFRFSRHGISVPNVKSWRGELDMTWFNIQHQKQGDLFCAHRDFVMNIR